jgi:hypothetical protein
MNTRCYRCGWSFSLSREAMEEAAVSSAGQKAHVIHCPRCRQAISIPMDQIIRALPQGWTPAAAGDSAATAGAAASAAPAADASAEGVTVAEVEAATNEAPASERADPGDRHQRRHRHSGKTNIGDSATVSAAKNSTHTT